ncbi:protein Skeletor, isoforms B/C-like [Amblyomma americanum]
MYSVTDSRMGGRQSMELSVADDEDRKSEGPMNLVLVLSVVLLFSFVAVLAVLLIGSANADDDQKNKLGDARADGGKTGIDGGRIPSPPLSVEIPIGPRKPPTGVTVTPAPNPPTARTLSPTHPPGAQTCPVGGYYGKRIGSIASYAHGVTGFVYAASRSSIVITNLNYDGADPAARFWAEYTQGQPDQATGDEISDETGGGNALKAYRQATVYLKLPKEITAYETLGIYSPQDKQYFGSVRIPSDYELPNEQSLGKPVSRFGNVMANELVLTDSSSMMLRGFLNDGQCPYTYFVVAPTRLPHPEELTYLIYDGNKMGELGIYNSTDVTIELPQGCHWNQFQWFSVFCIDGQSSLADIDIDAGSAERLPLHNPESVVRH